MQNIPSHEKSIRMMFTAATKEHTVEEQDNVYIVPYTDEVLTSNGWVKVKNLTIGDIICGEDTQDTIIDIKVDEEKNYRLYVQGDALL